MRKLTKLLIGAGIGAAAAGYAGSAAASVYVGVGWPAAIIAPRVVYAPQVAYAAAAPGYYAPAPGYYAARTAYAPSYYYGPSWHRRWHAWHRCDGDRREDRRW